MTAAVIFDLDGVLVDSEHLIAREMCGAFATHGHRIDAVAYHTRFHYVPLERIAEIVAAENGLDLPRDLVQGVRDRLADLYESELQAVDGVAEALRAIALPMAVASGSVPEGIDRKLRRTGLYDFFAPHIYSVFGVGERKPAPDIYLHVASELGLAPEDCVAVEDAAAGVEAGVAAGMRTLGFTGGGHDYPELADRLRAAGADVVFDDMRALPGLL